MNLAVDHFYLFRLCERNQEVNNNKRKAQELLNSETIHCLQSQDSDNHIEASASLVIVQNLAKLVNKRDHGSTDDNSVHEAIKFTRSVLEGKSDLIGNEVTIFQSIWLGDGLRLNKNVQTLIAKYYGCEIKFMPTVKNRVDVSKLKKKLQKLDQSGRFAKEFRTAVFYDVSPQDILLTSGFYIEMRWREPFIEDLTTKRTFHTSEDERTVVEAMVLKCGLVCINCDHINAKILELPLTAHNMSMLAILPHDKSLENISKNLTPQILENLMTQLRQSKAKPVHVTLPKFSLKQNGVLPSTFSETEDIIPPESDRILAPDCRIFQTSRISINENGINTMTGQSGATITGPAVHDGIKWTQFTATSPFLFMVVDMEYQIIFMIGKVSRPERTNDIERQSNEIMKSRIWCCM